MAITFLLGLLGCPGEDAAAKRAQERLKKSEAQKAEKKKRDAELDAQRQKARQGEPSLGPLWDDAKLLVPDAPCPVGLWALFPGPAPGADRDEAQANEASRAELASELKTESYVVKLRGPDAVTVGAADAATAQTGLQVSGSMECTVGQMRTVIAWSTGKVALLAPEDQGLGPGEPLLARVVFKLGAGEREKLDGKALLKAALVAVRVERHDGTLVVEKKLAP